MRIGIVITLLASAMVGGSVHAADGSCLDAYREGHQDYAKKLDGLKELASNLGYGKGGTLLAAAGCFWQTRSVAGCALLLGPVAGMTLYYGSEVQDEIKKAEDDDRIYEVYTKIESNDNDALAVKELADEVGTKKEPQVVALELKRMVDAGETCTKGSPSMTWDQIVTSLR
jgi:hypothetical protein